MRQAQRWMLGALLVGLGGFALVATDDLLKGPIYQADVPVNNEVSSLQDQGFPAHQVGNVLTQFGNSWTVAALTAVAAAWMFWKRQWILALWAIGIALATGAVLTGLKQVFQRVRPQDSPAHGYSFPSGHTLAAMAAVGALIILSTETYRRGRDPGAHHRFTMRQVWGFALALAGTIGVLTALGRVLVQAHWMSDVLASLLIGLGLAGGILLALSRTAPGGETGPKAPPPATP